MADWFQEELLDEKTVACVNRSIFKLKFNHHPNLSYGSTSFKC
ncbi:hypothetical protein THF5H11_40126 [Vibrio jasicida]|uniref:Transposase n=1 Tax=Vibrio jasicida TaxID=766224 RepID=A0AAU9QG87_9VIBR|nr:hypothetical protein THF5H11_40126 [Vibrio jasicida]CAH1560171.1 hypothetical protein THF1C08_110080 [Vibrio jasicida]CAH1568981.1 hypothetical protein THF1A12_100082 [Vibrio jasicida]